MNRFAQLWQDMVYIWDLYAGLYLRGIWQTINIAVLCTAVGCLIGLFCGVLNTIPCGQNEPLWKRIILKIVHVIIRVYVEVFRGTPMILQAVVIYYGLPYFTNNAMRFESMWLCAFVVVSINTGAYMAEWWYCLHRPRPDRRRKSNRYDPLADYGPCNYAPNFAEYLASDRQ